jgi:hypothetical protein
MTTQNFWQITDAQGRIIVAYVGYKAAWHILQYLQTEDGRMGPNAVTLQQMAGQ